MGNRQTCLDIDPFFDEEIILTPNIPVVVQVITPQSTVYLKFFNRKLKIFKDDTLEYDYSWTPQSHMRDFEVIDPFTEKELIIARGQGIGVIIIKSIGYIKLMFNEGEIVPAGFGIWDNREECKELLSADLALGYDVFIVSCNGTTHKLCEERNQRDEEETKILFSTFEKYADYEN